MSGAQLTEQSLGLLQIARVKPFGEPAVDRSEKLATLISLALIAPEPRLPIAARSSKDFACFWRASVSARPEYDFAFAMLGFGELSSTFLTMRDGLAIVKRFDRIAAADGAAFLDPAIEA